MSDPSPDVPFMLVPPRARYSVPHNHRPGAGPIFVKYRRLFLGKCVLGWQGSDFAIAHDLAPERIRLCTEPLGHKLKFGNTGFYTADNVQRIVARTKHLVEGFEDSFNMFRSEGDELERVAIRRAMFGPQNGELKRGIDDDLIAIFEAVRKHYEADTTFTTEEQLAIHEQVVRNKFGKFPAVYIFQHPTIAELGYMGQSAVLENRITKFHPAVEWGMRLATAWTTVLSKDSESMENGLHDHLRLTGLVRASNRVDIAKATGRWVSGLAATDSNEDREKGFYLLVQGHQFSKVVGALTRQPPYDQYLKPTLVWDDDVVRRIIVRTPMVRPGDIIHTPMVRRVE